ncbi:DUF4344 domain-containing metallopeptidase [Streptomyces sp. NPDC058646]|uniref:DUF4344 domain-containing metallopeptidase n=1 Tax=Streptomyces sp. NPDC058646 TaxID=3346574 RepID=UPI003660BBF8
MTLRELRGADGATGAAGGRRRPVRAARTAWAAAAVLLLPVTGCAAQPPGGGFVLRYEQPAPADRDSSRFLKDRAPAESTLADLEAYVALPYRVTVTARSCAGEGTGYDPARHRIELCYDDLAEERALFRQAGSRDPDGDLAEVVRETLLHEAGHALVDALDLPLDGDRAEEDAADRFAQLMLVRGGPEGEHALLTAARGYELDAAADPARGPDPSDEHAPPAVRAESHRCAVHGAAPARHPDLATPARAHCATTWARTQATWTRDLSPLLR